MNFCEFFDGMHFMKQKIKALNHMVKTYLALNFKNSNLRNLSKIYTPQSRTDFPYFCEFFDGMHFMKQKIKALNHMVKTYLALNFKNSNLRNLSKIYTPQSRTDFPYYYHRQSPG
jgi:hypothetical protein